MRPFGRRQTPDTAVTGPLAPPTPPAPVIIPTPVTPTLVPISAAPSLPPALAIARTELMTAELRQRVLEQVDPEALADLPEAALQRQVEQLIHDIANQERYEFSTSQQSRLAEEFVQDIRGHGPIEPLLREDDVSDIMVNGPNEVFVERRGKLELTDVSFRDHDHIAQVAQKILAGIGRRIDESSPIVDARLQDGSRVNVTFPPLAIDGPCISIRKFSRRRLSLTEMTQNGTMTSGVARLLGIAARARLNVLIAGGVGAGKTTLLNAMANVIDGGERIVSIEEVAELRLLQRHVIRLETRPRNLEGIGQVTQRDLFCNALRMRPDRIIVGEVRGAEVFDMLQAMNTGLDGSMTTIHANHARETLTRIETMLQMSQASLPVRALRSQIVWAIDLIVYLERMHDGQRRVRQITDVRNLEDDVIATNDIAAFEFDGEDLQGRIQGHYRASGVRPSFQARLDYFGLGKAWATAMAEA